MRKEVIIRVVISVISLGAAVWGLVTAFDTTNWQLYVIPLGFLISISAMWQATNMPDDDSEQT